VKKVLLIACLALALIPSAAQAATPWRAAGAVNDGLFKAQTALILDEDEAVEDARKATRAYERISGALQRSDPQAARVARRWLARAEAAAASGDGAALAQARGAVRGAIARGAYARITESVAAGDAQTARDWLLVRDFRLATRFTRPGADATLAVDELGSSKLSAEAAQAIVVKDLLDGYQARLRDLLVEAGRGEKDNLPERRAESAAQAAEYFRILRARYIEERGAAAADRAIDRFDALLALSVAGGKRFEAARVAAARSLDGFTAAPLTDEDAARRAQQLLRFLALVPVEYDRGVAGDKVNLDFEIQEAAAFQTGSVAALADLRGLLDRRDAASAKAAADSVDELGVLVKQAQRNGEGVASSDEVKDVTDRAEDALRTAMPDKWEQPTSESDYDLIALTLDRMEAAVGAAQYGQAEQARLEAYAFFEFGPERRLKALNPGIALDVESLVWFGDSEQDGLAKLIANKAPYRAVHEARLKLDQRLEDAAATLGDSASRTTVVTNAAIIVFREGLEAVLILAAITASMVGARSRLRRPVMIGAAGGLLVSIFTWVLAQTLLSSLEQYGEKLEAVVGLIAIAVLLLITNWFFHKVYWSEWIGRFHRQRKRYEALEKRGFMSAQAIGLAVLGLTSVYREGFETVLFLQSLELTAGATAVIEGAALGLAATFAVGAVTFLLQRKLPYKKMLIVTGLFIAVVLVVMVGQTARTMQGTGWIPITPIDVDIPFWMGLWLGIFPTVETIGAQVFAFAFVLGSYFLAQEVKVKRPRRKALSTVATAPAEPLVDEAGDHSENDHDDQDDFAGATAGEGRQDEVLEPTPR
jgi:high-affinity iron transporter